MSNYTKETEHGLVSTEEFRNDHPWLYDGKLETTIDHYHTEEKEKVRPD